MTQGEALSILKTGANAFLTGEPGSGKTHTVNAYIRWLHERGIEPAITASTGIAATHVGGMTIHAWSGIGVLSDLTEYDLDRISANERVARRVRNATVLIIDEISMLSAQTLSMVDAVCREIRRAQAPFGGLQVVMVGDFFQLPPVVKRQSTGFLDSPSTQFAFSSPAWTAANPLVLYLAEQHRQEDAEFLGVLSAIRSGTVDDDHREYLLSRVKEEAAEIGDAEVTRLYSHNADVDRMNEIELGKLSGLSRRYEMEGKGPDHLLDALKRGCLSPEFLTIKPGSRVMFTRNDPMGRYANGTLGTVIGFTGGHPIVVLENNEEVLAEPAEWKMEDAGKILATVTQVPLRLAWAITVHKSQGLTLDAALIDLSKAFEYGQGYVALSRVRSGEGLTLSGINERALAVHPEIREKDMEFKELSEAARETFANLGVDELAQLEKNFIRAAGGVETPFTKEELDKPKAAREGAKRLEATMELVREGKSLRQVAEARGRTAGTILEHLEKLVEAGKAQVSELRGLAKGFETEVKKAQDAIRASKDGRLKAIYEKLGGKVSYDTIRLARLLMRD
ncbi:MAG: helix-turn-helix domain-containing protein [Candidatus Pacebacteria bacterium]|nr:helix-turn-helix domain-containing protein [Candidatus Paceibacterota bacterium]MBP9840064.1 helix-turn-helix domain-containing protein [Candidatus Paceibacterota bacterium]